LSLRDTAEPFPVDLHLANGSTHVSLVGTVQDPLAFKGADLQLDLAGETMANLYPLTAIPIPATPPYQVRGQLGSADGRVRFEQIDGTVGHSDLEGSVAEAPGQDRPDVTMDLTSRRVDLADLGGFIGAPSASSREAAPATDEGRKAAEAARGGGLVPATPIAMPKLQTADIHLHYRADRIEAAPCRSTSWPSPWTWWVGQSPCTRSGFRSAPAISPATSLSLRCRTSGCT